jgi:hypothetical protein
MDKNKKRNPIAQYFLNIALGFDQLLSSFRGWDSDETVSSMLGKLERHYGKTFAQKRFFAYLLAQSLNRIELAHCVNAIEEDEGKNSIADRNIAIEGAKK